MLQGSFQLLGGLKDIFLGENPSSPMHTESLFALGILEDFHCIMGIRVGGTPHMAGGVCTNGDQAKIKWTPELTDLLESRADGEVVLRVVVIFSFGQLRDLSVSGVSVPRVSLNHH